MRDAHNNVGTQAAKLFASVGSGLKRELSSMPNADVMRQMPTALLSDTRID